MPLIASFEKHGLIESIRELRKRPAGTYGIAIAAVGLAVALRMAVGSQLLPGLSFITFYPAIIIAALVGGFSRGLLATVLSALAAWYLFVPTYEGWGLDYYSAFSLALFCVICLANLGLVYLLDTAIDRALSQEQNVRTLIQSAPNGVLVVDNDGRITLVNASLEQLFGYKQSELLGREVEMLVNEITAPKHRQLREAYAAHPEARPMGWGRDLSARRKDGSEFPVEIGLNPIKRNGNMASSQPSSTSPSACGRRNHSNSSFESCTIGHRTCLR
jgi:PAS domain S-box-containing protein